MIVVGLLQTINQTHVSMFSHFFIFTLYRIFTNSWNLFRGSILDIETNMKVNMRKCRLRRIFQVRNNLILTSTSFPIHTQITLHHYTDSAERR